MSHFIVDGELFTGCDMNPIRKANEVEIEFHDRIVELERQIEDAWGLVRSALNKLEE